MPLDEATRQEIDITAGKMLEALVRRPFAPMCLIPYRYHTRTQDMWVRIVRENGERSVSINTIRFDKVIPLELAQAWVTALGAPEGTKVNETVAGEMFYASWPFVEQPVNDTPVQN